MPKVSVIIPTYNRASYVVEAIESVLNQTWKDLEIIVMDDGSTDNTEEVLYPYVRSGGIKYFYQENTGKPGAARNAGLNHSKGKYICFLDSDDLLSENSILIRVNVLDNNEDVCMVSSNWKNFNSDFQKGVLENPPSVKDNYLDRIPKCLIKRKENGLYVFNKEFVFELLNYRRLLFSASLLIVRGDLLNKIGLFDEKFTIGEDLDFCLRAAEEGNIAFISEPTVYLRKHVDNISGNIERDISEDKKVIEKFIMRKKGIPFEILKRFYKNLSIFYFNNGYYFFDKGEFHSAQKEFWSSFRYNPFSINIFIYLALSYLPPSVIEFLRIIKRKIGFKLLARN